MKLHKSQNKTSFPKKEINHQDLKLIKSRCVKQKESLVKSLFKQPAPCSFTLEEYSYLFEKYGSWSRLLIILKRLTQANGDCIFEFKSGPGIEYTPEHHAFYAKIVLKYMDGYVDHRAIDNEKLLKTIGMMHFHTELSKSPEEFNKWVLMNNLLCSKRANDNADLLVRFETMLKALYEHFGFINRAEANALRKMLRYREISIPENYPISDEGCETLLTKGKGRQLFFDCMIKITGEPWSEDINYKHAYVYKQNSKLVEVVLDSYFEADVLRALIEMELLPTHFHYIPPLDNIPISEKQEYSIDFAWIDEEKENVLISLEALMSDKASADNKKTHDYNKKEENRSAYFKKHNIPRICVVNSIIHRPDTFVDEMGKVGKVIGEAIGKKPKPLTVAYRKQVLASKANKDLIANDKVTLTNIRKWVRKNAITIHKKKFAPSFGDLKKEFGNKVVSTIRGTLKTKYRDICRSLGLDTVNGSVPRTPEEYLTLAEDIGCIDIENKRYIKALTGNSGFHKLQTSVKIYGIVKQFNTTNYLPYDVKDAHQMLAAMGYTFEKTVRNGPPIIFRSAEEIILALCNKGEKNKIKAITRGKDVSELVQTAIKHFFGENSYSSNTQKLKELVMSRADQIEI